LQRSGQGRAFHSAKSGFAGRSKDFSHGLLFALLNQVIEIQKLPAEPLTQRPPDGSLSGSHEPDEDHAWH
jgi:hypothetical protein